MAGSDLTDIKVGLATIQATQVHHGAILEKIDKRQDDLDKRLRDVEAKSAIYGGVTGGVISVAIAFITAKLTGKA